ncbi:MAG: hypothetical protein N4A40_12915 [Tissierellales bacterium]|nr:hypothetical protein [Tissierellales bacterium]
MERSKFNEEYHKLLSEYKSIITNEKEYEEAIIINRARLSLLENKNISFPVVFDMAIYFIITLIVVGIMFYFVPLYYLVEYPNLQKYLLFASGILLTIINSVRKKIDVDKDKKLFEEYILKIAVLEENAELILGRNDFDGRNIIREI